MAVPVTTAPRTIDSLVSSLARVKPLDARRLAKLGIESVRDLLLTLPFDWELYGAPKRVAELRDGESATVVGTVAGSAAQITTRKRVRLTKATLRDDAGDLLRLVWFNQPYLARNLPPGMRLAVAGRVKGVNEGFEMLNPHHESLASVDESAGPRRIGGLMPKYHLVAGLSSKRMAEFVEEAMPMAEQLEDVLPAETRLRMGLLGVV